MRRVGEKKHLDSQETCGHPVVTPFSVRGQQGMAEAPGRPKESIHKRACALFSVRTCRSSKSLECRCPPGASRWTHRSKSNVLCFFSPQQGVGTSEQFLHVWEQPEFSSAENTYRLPKEVSQQWIKPWVLADLDHCIPAETCMDQQPGATISSCSSQPLNLLIKPHEKPPELQHNPGGRRNPDLLQKLFCYPAEWGICNNIVTFLIHLSLEIKI